MKTHSWRRHYESNLLNRTEPDWQSACLLAAERKKILSVSLSHFQLGETGGGSFLLRNAAKKTDADDLAALALFIAEEKEHARLLARMVERLGGTLVGRHWTHRLFKLARRAGGFRFEIQMLLTAEIVGTAYYELLKKSVNDPVTESALGLMLRDEAAHVAFHLDRLRARWQDYLPMERALWAGQFQVLLLLALRAAWLDHGPCLRTFGHDWTDFSGRARRIAIRFLDGLETQVACRTCDPARSMEETSPA